MIILENSEKSIDGLAKLIIQEPRLIPELKIIQEQFSKYNVLSKDATNKKYLENQLEIINKAEEIVNKSLWYGFEIYDTFNGEEKGFILYKRVKNEMVPIDENFSRGLDPYFELREFHNFKNTLKKMKIKNLITYTPHDQDTVYSQQYEDEEGEEEPSTDYEHMHQSLHYIEELKKSGIKVTEYNDEQVRHFEKDLELISGNE